MLSNKDKRAMYDRFGHEGANMGSAGGFNTDFQDFGNVNLQDIFSQLFEGAGFNPFGGAQSSQQMNPNAPQKGKDLQVCLSLFCGSLCLYLSVSMYVYVCVCVCVCVCVFYVCLFVAFPVCVSYDFCCLRLFFFYF